jgi:flagellar hook-associated protein 1 FlgK
MSFLGIATAGSALDAYQDAENVTSQNISNVSVPGASRQIANLSQAPPIDGSPLYPGAFSPGTQGTGVVVSSITRVHQDSYDALFRGASSSQYFYSVQQSSLSALQSALGEPSSGINSAYQNFQTAVQTLVNNPSGTPERTGLLSAAQALVQSLNNASQSIVSQQTQVQNQANSYINTINSTVDQIAALNGQIRAQTAIGANPNTYKDQRDQLIDTLSQYVSTQTFVQPDGSTLVTVDGHALVNDTVTYHLAAPVIGTNPDGTPSFKVGFVGDPTPANPTAISTSGQLGGLIDLYNNKLIPYANTLNDFANGLATEADKISQAGYDQTGQPGGQLFSPVVTQLPISAGNIQVGISTASEVPASLASTAGGTLVQPLNSANNIVDTTVPIVNNSSLANAPAADLSGTLTVQDDGLTTQQVYCYSTANATSTITGALAPVASTTQIPIGTTSLTVANGASFVGLAAGTKIVIGSGPSQELVTFNSVAGNTINISATTNAHLIGDSIGGNATSIGQFVTSFNASHFGVTASFNATSQQVVFSRDPTNIDLNHRALVQAAGTSVTPDFTIIDSNLGGVTGPAQPSLGTAATSLLTALGANQINKVDQNATNAFGATSGAGANALLSLFSASLGAPGVQAAVAIPAAGYGPGSVTITAPAANPTAFQNVNVGDVLTVYDGQPPSSVNQENVTVTAINRNTNQITFTLKNSHPNTQTNLYITSAQTQTLQTYYGNFVAQVGLDTQTATTGNTTQTNLSSNINSVRQSTDGINIDEETQNLIKFQNAYAAAAHVINTLNTMLGYVINLGS